MPIVKTVKAKSPTGKPSKVRQEMKDFDAGKKVAGKRPVVKAKKKVVKKAVLPKFPIRSKSYKAAKKL